MRRRKEEQYSELPKDDSKEQEQKRERKRAQLGPFVWLVLALGVVLLSCFVHYCHLRLPEPLDPNPDNTRFSEKRAFVILNELSDVGPKPSGSHACEVETIDILRRELSLLKKNSEKGEHKLEIELQHPSSCFDIPKFDVDGFGLCYRNVSNIIVRLTSRERSESKNASGAILLNCHYDSWVTSPAGSDDLASCAVMLEVIRILGDPKAKPVPHDIIFLFNGAEEASLLAAHGFITQHGYRHEIKGFINMEASGSGGREILFQSGPDSQWLLNAYLESAPRPFCSVVGQEVFQSGIVPSDTDFRVFRDHGKMSGLDFAFAQNAYWWHTEFDEARRISPGSLQRAGENILEVLRYVLKDGYFAKHSTIDRPNFVFFDFLGFTAFAYSRTVAWILNVLGAAAVFVAIWKRLGDFGHLGISKLGILKYWIMSFFLYPLILAVIFLCNRYQIYVLNEVFDGKLLWLSKHSVVIPLFIIPAVFYCFMDFSFFIMLQPSPEIRIAFAWGLFDAHNIFMVVAMWIITAFGSAAGFIFLAMLIPTLLDAVARVIIPNKGHTIHPYHHLLYTIPMAIPGLLSLIYNFEVVLSTFIPILGRSKGDTDLLICILCSFIVFMVFFLTIPLIGFSSPKVANVVKMVTLLVAIISVVGAVTFAKPYYYNDPFPTVKRTQFFHVKNNFLTNFKPNAKEDKFEIEESETILAIAQDNRQVHDIPIVSRDSGFKEIDCEKKGKFCSLPFLFPTPHRLGPNMIREKKIKDNSLKVEKAWAKLVDKKENNEEVSYFFKITGSDQIGLTIEPIGQIEVAGWRLVGEEKFVCNATFVFLHCIGKNCGNWDLEIAFRNVDSLSMNVVDISVASHTLHGENMYSETLENLHKEIEEKRATGDWRWAMTASSWTVDFFKRRF
ncbi:hypothetical protein FO519_004931 [Halicephalobus sp. NKZ332]|nr:hypothetical protein FO519_004931 [Halicephalobus sp. NKZ332]